MNLSLIRKNFAPAEFDKTICFESIAMLEPVKDSDHFVWRAYKPAFKMISANFLFSPIEKLNAFQQGKNGVEKVIAEFPAELELRYIRLALQMRSPSFLGYKDCIETDKRFILKNLKPETEPELKELILGFVNTQQGIEASYRAQIQKNMATIV
jgi:hypothetical protein